MAEKTPSAFKIQTTNANITPAPITEPKPQAKPPKKLAVIICFLVRFILAIRCLSVFLVDIIRLPQFGLWAVRDLNPRHRQRQ